MLFSFDEFLFMLHVTERIVKYSLNMYNLKSLYESNAFKLWKNEQIEM